MPVGSKVSLDPFTGSVTFPDGFIDLLRQNRLKSIQGGGITFTLFDETGDEVDVFFEFGDTEVPEAGSMTVELTGDGGDVPVKKAGTNTLVAGDFVLALDPGPVGPAASSTPTATVPSGPPTSLAPGGPPTSPAPSAPADPVDAGML